MQDMQAVDGGEERPRRRAPEHWRTCFLEAARGDDFIGVQTYTRQRFGPDGMLDPEPGVPRTHDGLRVLAGGAGGDHPPGRARSTGVPVLVTENGIATDDDRERVEYVARALEGVLGCLADGLDVRGYTYWSLLDNFEWAYGYRPAFGLVAVDRTTQVRTAQAERALAGPGRAREHARVAPSAWLRLPRHSVRPSTLRLMLPLAVAPHRTSVRYGQACRD